MRKDEYVTGAVAYEGKLIEITEEKYFNSPRVWSPNKTFSTILGPNSKSLQSFHPWTPIKGLRVIVWLAR